MTKHDKPVKWTDVKKALPSQDPKELLALIKDLYSLSPQNKTFIQTKYSLIDPLKPYMVIIGQCISLDYRKPINLAGAKKAISQYRKAVGDPKGILELMVFYVECGNDLTVEFGDIDERFYCSMESMFEKALQALSKSDEETIEKYLPRLQTIVEKADGIGWGYYDTISDLLYEYFPPKE
jgi:hypothetical protein